MEKNGSKSYAVLNKTRRKVLKVAKEREKPMREQLKALHYEATTTVGSSQNPRSSHNRTKACANKDIDHLSPISIHITS